MMDADFAKLSVEKPPEGREALYAFAEWNPVFLRPDGRPWPGWEAKVIERVPLPMGATLPYLDGAKVTKLAVHRKVVTPLYKALVEIQKQKLWEHLGPYGGGYEFRRVGGSQKLSLHALGMALDFDPDANARDVPPEKTRFGSTEEGKRIVRIFHEHGWYWGGRFTTRPDAMHFQFATGV